MKEKDKIRLCSAMLRRIYYCVRYAIMRVMHRLCSCIICSRECTGTVCDSCSVKLIPYTSYEKTCLSGDNIVDTRFHDTVQTTECIKISSAGKTYISARTLPMFATWLYDENIKKLFLAYKKKGLHIVSYKFAHEAYNTLVEAMRFVQMHRAVNSEKVYIVPLPAHPKNKKKLGFSPTGIISRYLAFLLQWNHAPILFRIHSRVQKQLHKSERWKNIHDTLHVKSHAYRTIKNAELMVLFDDVITTSATMHAAYYKVQKAFPDAFVIGVALSRVKSLST